MRIIQVIDTLAVGGAEKVFVDLTNILYEQRLEVSTLFLLQPGTLSSQLYSGIHQHVLNRGFKWSPFKMFRCASIISHYDIVHCHHRFVYAYVNLCAILFRIKVKIILHDHYGLIELNQHVPRNISSVLRPKFFVGVSDKLTKWAKEQLKIEADNVFLLPNIIRYYPLKEVLEKKYDLILVSNIKPVKNQLFAIELAKKAQKSILLVGQNQDEKYYNLVINDSKEGNIVIDSSVINAQAIMPLAKFGLHTSKSETGPLVLIEYLAQGIPFLAYETGEVSKILKPYFPDFFIDSFEFDLWLERIEKIQNSPIDKEKMQQVFEKYFGKRAYCEKLRTIYKCIKGS